MNETRTRPVRGGARDARRAMRKAPDFAMLPSLARGIPYCEPMDPDQIARIDNASMAILEDVGVVFRDDIALEGGRGCAGRTRPPGPRSRSRVDRLDPVGLDLSRT